MSPTLRLAIAVTRGWTALYTAGLSEVARERRRNEIESDLWEHQASSKLDADAEVDVAFDVFVRMLLGMPADMTWRFASARTAKAGSTKGPTMLTKLFAAITTVVSVFAGGFFVFVAVGRTSDGAEAFAAPLLFAGLALLGGAVAAFWSPRIGTTLVAVGAALIVFMLPWMAGATVPLAILLVLGTLVRGRMRYTDAV